MNIDTHKVKKVMTMAIPSVIVFIISSYFSCSYRTAIGTDTLDKFSTFIDNLSNFNSFQNFNIIDFLIGIVGALAFQVFLYFRKKNKKKFYEDEEYGNARWGNEKDIKPYMNPVFEKIFFSQILNDLIWNDHLTLNTIETEMYYLLVRPVQVKLGFILNHS